MSREDVELLLTVAMLIQGDHAGEAARLRELAKRIEHDPAAGLSGTDTQE